MNRLAAIDDASAVAPAITTFGSIQALRAIAAAAVMLCHVLGLSLGTAPYLTSIAQFTLRLFPAGVDVFFVISGFIITRSVYSPSSRGRADGAIRFLARRFIRIYPVFWIVFACAFLIDPWITMGTEIPGAVRSLTLPNIFLWVGPPQNYQNYYVQTAWTLTFEVHFYAAVAVGLLLLPRQIFSMTICAMTIVASLWALDIQTGYVLANPLVLEFGFGAIIAVLARRGVSKFPIVSAIASLILLGYGAFWIDPPLAGLMTMSRVMAWGTGAALLVYSFVAIELRGVRFHPLLQYLGAASYSLYIWHLAIIKVLVATGPALLILFPGPAIVIGWIAATYALSIIAYRYLETPILRTLRNLMAPIRHQRYWPFVAVDPAALPGK